MVAGFFTAAAGSGADPTMLVMMGMFLAFLATKLAACGTDTYLAQQ